MSEISAPEEIARWHRRMAADLFNPTWELLEAERTAEQDEEMLAAALASWLHWRRVGAPMNHAVADWQAARVCTVLGDIARAEAHARSSLATAETAGLGPFYVGYACEALARAAARAGDAAACDVWLERAWREAAAVADEDERRLLAADLDTI